MGEKGKLFLTVKLQLINVELMMEKECYHFQILWYNCFR